MVGFGTLSASGIGDVTTGITNLMSIVESLFTSITGNTYLVIIFAAGFVGLAAKVIRKMVKASKSVGN